MRNLGAYFPFLEASCDTPKLWLRLSHARCPFIIEMRELRVRIRVRVVYGKGKGKGKVRVRVRVRVRVVY